jgi:AcrR family transcriptional regulator
MAADPRDSALRERKKERTRRRLRENAARLFAARGFARTVIADIAAAANVSARTSFRYSGSKEALLLRDPFGPRRLLSGRRGERLGRAPRRRFRKPLVVTALVVTAALVLTAVADVVVEYTVRHRIAQAAACKLRPSGAVSARFGGTLAGLRLLTGELGTLRISARDVRRDGIAMSVDVELYDVTTKGATSGGRASATVGYAQLGGRLGSAAAGLAPGPDGSGGLVLTGRLAGIPLPLTVHTRLTTTASTLTVTPAYLSLLGADFPLGRASANRTTSALARKLAPRTVRLPGLPAGVRLTGARATGDGIVLTLTLPRSDGSAHSLTAHACSRQKP